MLAGRQGLLRVYSYENILKRSIDRFIYGQFNNLTVTTLDEDNQFDFDEFKKCLSEQYQRAVTRLIAYRFVETFTFHSCNMHDQKLAIMKLNFYLAQLRHSNLEWSYLENSQALNSQLKTDIRQSYYHIVKIVLSRLMELPTVQLKILIRSIFGFLNLNYECDDICSLNDHQIIQTLLSSFVNFINKGEQTVSLDIRFIAFNWFRLFTLRLCAIMHFEELKGLSNQILHKQREFIFNKFILSQLKELRQLKQYSSVDKNGNSIDSLKNVAIGWFIHATTTQSSNEFASSYEIELCINQFLILLLECISRYEHVQSFCATFDYIEELLDIYQHSQHKVTSLLALKILRQLISSLSSVNNETLNNLIEKFLVDSLILIGENYTSKRIPVETINELINIYRQIMSSKSSYQIVATQFIVGSLRLKRDEKSLEINDISKIIASLCILGGYIQPICLASLVKVFNNKKEMDQSQLGMIIEVDKTLSNSDINEMPSYLVQYFETNQIESVKIDQLQVAIDISPPNLLSLPNTNQLIHSVLDTLGYFIQMNTNSYLLLQIKRRAISALYHLLSNQVFIEAFMQKSYASVLGKLATFQLIKPPNDLLLFNKEHLEQYCLSLEEHQSLIDDNISNSLVTDNEDNLLDRKVNYNQNIVDALSTSVWKYNGWKRYTPSRNLELINKGRLGDNQWSIVSMPRDVANEKAIELCGNKHRFKGRIYVTPENTTVSFPTFIVDNVRVTEGKWYFCVRLPVAGLVQIGWATDGFSPGGNDGIGDDLHSWSYDGSRATLFYNNGFRNQFKNLRWKENDVCGCGIEIADENINIKYWLNGKFLGTGFSHQEYIPLSSTECNLLPNGPNTSYFPGVSLQSYCSPPRCCEFIFSPEDMEDCPLPHGYKPLFLSEFINVENSLVAYPFSAYLIGDNAEDYFFDARTGNRRPLLRDFVNDNHLETLFSIDKNQLILSEDSSGFPLSINNDVASFTITFDFRIDIDEQIDIQLLAFDPVETFSIVFPFKKTDEKIRTVLVFFLEQRQVTVHLNNKSQIFNIQFDIETISTLNFHLLPKLAAGITHIGIWKYALSKEHIQRLFTYGLFYVVTDYQQVKEYRKQVNSFSFNEHEFQSELLVPFDRPFDNEIGRKRKSRQMTTNQTILNHQPFNFMEIKPILF